MKQKGLSVAGQYFWGWARLFLGGQYFFGRWAILLRLGNTFGRLSNQRGPPLLTQASCSNCNSNNYGMGPRQKVKWGHYSSRNFIQAKKSGPGWGGWGPLSWVIIFLFAFQKQFHPLLLSKWCLFSSNVFREALNEFPMLLKTVVNFRITSCTEIS